MYDVDNNDEDDDNDDDDDDDNDNVVYEATHETDECSPLHETTQRSIFIFQPKMNEMKTNAFSLFFSLLFLFSYPTIAASAQQEIKEACKVGWEPEREPKINKKTGLTRNLIFNRFRRKALKSGQVSLQMLSRPQNVSLCSF